MDPQPMTADRSGAFGMGNLNVEFLKMLKDVCNRAELQQFLLFDPDAEAGVGFNQNLVKPERIDADIVHQQCFRGNRCGIGTRDSMEDLDQALFEFLLVSAGLGQLAIQLLSCQRISAVTSAHLPGTS